MKDNEEKNAIWKVRGTPLSEVEPLLFHKSAHTAHSLTKTVPVSLDAIWMWNAIRLALLPLKTLLAVISGFCAFYSKHRQAINWRASHAHHRHLHAQYGNFLSSVLIYQTINKAKSKTRRAHGGSILFIYVTLGKKRRTGTVSGQVMVIANAEKLPLPRVLHYTISEKLQSSRRKVVETAKYARCRKDRTF